MGYATVADVEAIHSGRAPFTAQSKPSATQVVRLIDFAAARVDEVLTKAGYDTPIPPTASGTPTSAWDFLAAINAQGAACAVERSAQVSNRRTDFCDAFDSALKMLADGELPGIEKGGAGGSLVHGFDTLASPVSWASATL